MSDHRNGESGAFNDSDQGGHRRFDSATMPQLSTFPFPQLLAFTLERRARPYARKRISA